MFWEGLGTVTLIGLAVFSVGITLVANWAATGFERPQISPKVEVATLVLALASLFWMTLVFLAGVLAARYSERLPSTFLGYAVFIVTVAALSLARALLHNRVMRAKALSWPHGLVHSLLYCLAAVTLYLLLSLILQVRAQLVLFVPLCMGALLPDLGDPTSPLGRLLPSVSRPLNRKVGDAAGEWHSLGTCGMLALLTAWLVPFVGAAAWFWLWFGFLAHLTVDLVTPKGVMLFWPVTHRRFSIGAGIAQSSRRERLLFASLVLTTLLLTVAASWGPAPTPGVARPSFDESVGRYYSMRGNNQVFARIEGSWQTSGSRQSGTYEILNAVGDTFVLLDRYDGTLFTAGRDPANNLYISSITLRLGPAVRVKPVEVHLESESLAAALPTVYQMQQETGLQHIYVSGDVIVNAEEAKDARVLRPDYAQARLRRIQSQEPGHFTLHYLTGGEFIALGGVVVESADLVLSATYVDPATGPTVTPLPILP